MQNNIVLQNSIVFLSVQINSSSIETVKAYRNALILSPFLGPFWDLLAPLPGPIRGSWPRDGEPRVRLSSFNASATHSNKLFWVQWSSTCVHGANKGIRNGFPEFEHCQFTGQPVVVVRVELMVLLVVDGRVSGRCLCLNTGSVWRADTARRAPREELCDGCLWS